uniref:Pleckstrin homology and RhoGEF domain containing G7 n=1 Tax=Otolemur garnettii TaxID=30611 RepID=H0XW42_OTOGA
MEKQASSCPVVLCPDVVPSPQHPARSLSERHCESQGWLLQFDRQAPGRISTSPTLRRLRGSGCGTLHSLPQQEGLQVPTWGSWGESVGCTHYLSKSLPGHPEAPPHSLSSWRLRSKLPSDPEQTLDTADSFKLQTRPTDQCVLPELQSTDKESLHQASLPGQEAHSPPRPTLRCPGPQGEESRPSRYVCSCFLQCYDIY